MRDRRETIVDKIIRVTYTCISAPLIIKYALILIGQYIKKFSNYITCLSV